MPSWKPADNYSPDAFYTEASDKKGRGTPVNARIPPQVSHNIAALVQSGKIPQYETMSDFIRNALVHQLHRDLERVNDQLALRRLNMVILLNEEIRAQREHDDYQQLMNLIETRHLDFLNRGKAEESRLYLKGRLSEIDAIPERFQEDYEKRLSQKLYPV
jgi:Arc/MetJ-type ribon-helix-helix transcriptional regulator